MLLTVGDSPSFSGLMCSTKCWVNLLSKILGLQRILLRNYLIYVRWDFTNLRFRVHLNITYFAENWKHCNKIIFKCVNNVVGPIFNENFVEKRGLWVPWTVYEIHWLLRNAHLHKKKKKTKTQTQGRGRNPNVYLV